MAFNDLSLAPSDKSVVKLPKGFGASDAVGAVVELTTNNQLGDRSIFLELFSKKESADVLTKKTVKNFFKYLNKGVYDNSIFHRSVPGFVLQGGGFSAPLAPADEGGSIDPVDTFNPIKNEPGNSNRRGTIAMAKLAGDPDSATSQWFVNLEDNLSLDTQNEGFTVFGKVLGNGMEVVDYLASVEVYNFGGPYTELPLWQLVQKPDGSLDVGPEDFLIVSSAEKLKSKKQPFVLSAESSDDSIVQVSVTNNQRIKLKTPKNASGTATISVEAVSTVDGTVDADRFDVVIGGSAQARSMERSAKKSSKFIDIFVDGGSFDDPFYRFFDSNGDELDRLKINVKKKYRFHRQDEVASHPFYISDSGYNTDSTKSLKLKGDGTFADGITGSEMFSFSVRKADRKAFKKEAELSYYCTAHSSMIGTFAIEGQKNSANFMPQESADVSTINDSTTTSSGGYYRAMTDVADQLPLI